jgi:hypothetical protein
MKTDAIKYVVLEQLITENRVTQAKEAYPCIPPALINYLSSKDPSGNNKYLAWMCKQIYDKDCNLNECDIAGYTTIWSWLEDYYDYHDDYKDNDEHPHTLDNCKETWNDNGESIRGFEATEIRNGGWERALADIILEEVTYFHRFLPNLKQKDINNYPNYQSLSIVLTEPKLKAVEKGLAKDVTKIYEDDTWLMTSPKTHQASCVYGANTKWCVTMRDDPNYFERYTRGNFYLIFVINKKNNKKWAINTEQKLDQPSEDVVINIPWHKEIELNRKGADVRERYRRNHNKYVENAYRNRFRDIKTTYWDAEDRNITWEQFIGQAVLPKNLQHLLKAIEKKIIINFTRKKKTDVAYELNPSPVRLKKGDHVKLLASGYGVYRGDEGVITSTIDGAPGRQKELNPEDAGRYRVHVPGREPYHAGNDRIKMPDGTIITVPTVTVGGNFLQKIDKKKKA